MPYWRLSSFYWFYFASLGALVPYWGLYLKSLGFNPQEIGVLIAITMATKIISPNIWGWIADHTGARMLIVRLGSFLALVTFAGVFVNQNYLWLVLVMVLFSFFWNATLPQFEVTTLNYLGNQPQRYTGIRLWGSIGFILTSFCLGPVIDQVGVSWVPWVVLILFAGIWLSSLLVSEKSSETTYEDSSSIIEVLRRPWVLALLFTCFLLQMSHGSYYAFYTIYLEERDYSSVFIGSMWAIGVLAEVVLFIFMHSLVPRFGLRFLFMASLALTAIRWLLIALFVEHTVVVVFAQLLHAASFGLYHASAIQLIHRYFSGRHQGKGQALYSSVSFGAGGALGSYFSGVAWEPLGGEMVFLIMAGVAALGVVVSYKWVATGHSEDANGAKVR